MTRITLPQAHTLRTDSPRLEMKRVRRVTLPLAYRPTRAQAVSWPSRCVPKSLIFQCWLPTPRLSRQCQLPSTASSRCIISLPAFHLLVTGTRTRSERSSCLESPYASRSIGESNDVFDRNPCLPLYFFLCMSRKQIPDVVGAGVFFCSIGMFLCSTDCDTCLATETEIDPDRVAFLTSKWLQSI